MRRLLGSLKKNSWRAGGLALLLIAVGAFLFGRHSARVAEGPVYRDASGRLAHRTWSSYLDTPNAAGVCVVDVNADGRPDLFFPGLGEFNTDRSMLKGLTEADLGNRLYLNRRTDADGLPVFEDVTDAAGVRNLGKLGSGCAAADYDNDGRVDLAVANATKGVTASEFGDVPIGFGERIFPPKFFRTEGTDGKYDFPAEGGVTLFRNERVDDAGIPHFRDATFTAKVTRGGNGTIVLWGDVDRDGYVDLFAGNYVDMDFAGFTYPRFAGGFDVLYRNNGDGTFTDVTASAGVGGEPEFVYDLAGKKQFGWDPAVVDKKGRIVGDPAGNTLAAAFIYNGELPDLVIASDIPGRIRYYKNLGEFRFQEVSDEYGFGQSGSWMGLAVGDVNNDGKEDIFATNSGGPSGSRYRPRSSTGTDMLDIRNPPNKATFYNNLWLAEGNSFRNPTRGVQVDWGTLRPDIRWYPPEFRQANNASPQPAGLEEGDFGFGTVMFDHDNDGDQDLAWAGSLRRFGTRTYIDYLRPGRLLENLGGGESFRDVAGPARARNQQDQNDPETFQNGRGFATADFNLDGYPDLVITNAGGFDAADTSLPELDLGRNYLKMALVREFAPGPTFLLVSGGGKNHWSGISLRGTRSNRSAIGAKVTLAYRENGMLKRQVRAVHGGGSYASENSLELLFGLGAADTIEEVTVAWPSGTTQTLTNVEINRHILITES
jgi:enediyne biosynthesis protein E4